MAHAANAAAPAQKSPESAKTEAAADKTALFTPESVASEGSVTVEGQKIDYKAVAGTLIVHPKGWDDAAHADAGKGDDKADKGPEAGGGPEASMFYVAYFKKGAPAAGRPITFLYNGGPGSSTV